MTDLWNFAANSDADQAARVAIFEKISPAGNWKLPIDAWIDRDDFTACYEAAVWFTGGGLNIAEHSLGSHRVRVVGNGYYANIGA